MQHVEVFERSPHFRQHLCDSLVQFIEEVICTREPVKFEAQILRAPNADIAQVRVHESCCVSSARWQSEQFRLSWVLPEVQVERSVAVHTFGRSERLHCCGWISFPKNLF